MYVLFGDETNTEPARDVEFFIYGALLLADDQIVDVHQGIEVIRDELGLGHREPLKFTDRPKRITVSEHRDAKRAVLELLGDVGATFIAYCVHHDVAKGRNIIERNEYALNTILWGFHRFLDRKSDYGLVILDQVRREERYMISRLNTEGLQMFDGSVVLLPRIVGVAAAHVEWSHCLSACDVLLGAFRYCVNKPDAKASKEMFPPVADRLWYWEDAAGDRHVREYGLFLRPQRVKAPRLKARYDALVKSLERLTGED